MKRRKKESGESLDMLLDTITNTFGGLIFIAILVALLVGQQQPDVSNFYVSNEVDIEKMEKEIRSLQLEIDLLKQNQRMQDELSSRFVNQEQANLAAKVNQTRSSVTQSESEIQQLKSEIQSTNENLGKANQRLANIENQTKVVSRELSAAKKVLDQEKEKRTTNIDSPVLKTTQKRPRIFMVKRGKIYVISQDRISSTFGINTSDFEKASALDADLNLGSRFGFWKTKKSGGIPLVEKDRVQKLMSPIDKDRNFVNLAIYEDSFEQFQSIREVLVDKKLEYSLLLLKDGEQVVESSSAQRPKVQ